jgi:peptidoglycan-associated lipoprotein
MRRISMVAALALAVAVLAGCPSTYPNCKSDDTCKEHNGEVCVNGQCQECATDANCKQGFVCQGNKCVPPPVKATAECTGDAQCTGGKICEGSKCVDPQCTSKTQCTGAQDCLKGRCALPPGACNASTDCGADQECKDNKCVAAAAQSTCNWEPVHFGFNEATLPPEAQSRLGDLAKCIKDARGKVELGGHADERGTEEYNLQLSQKRAASVKKYLVDLGVPGNKLKTVGYGENKPAVQGSNEEAWAANRRVEFVR